MVYKTVLKVEISCDKCKQKLFKAVSTLQGVDKIEIDEVKGTLTVTGKADPYNIIMAVRKADKTAHFDSVGPPLKPEEKKKEPEKKSPFPGEHWVCNPMPVNVMPVNYQDPVPQCSIM